MRARALRLVAALSVLALALTGGAVAEDAEELELFLRGGTGTDCAAMVYTLQVEAGTGEGICGYIGGGPFGEVFHALGTDTSKAFPATGEANTPRLLDASRNLTGTLTVAPYVTASGDAGSGVGQVVADVLVTARVTNPETGQTLNNRTLGTQTIEGLAHPASSRQRLPVDLDIATQFDGFVATNLTLTVTIRGVHAAHGFLQPNGESFITVPVLPEPEPAEDEV